MQTNLNRQSRWYFGGLASAGAACITHPLDLLKVHLQTGGGVADKSCKIYVQRRTPTFTEISYIKTQTGQRRVTAKNIRYCDTATAPKNVNLLGHVAKVCIYKYHELLQKVMSMSVLFIFQADV